MKKSVENEGLKKILFYVIIALFIFLSYLIIQDFIIPIISAFILSYLLKPIYFYLEKKLGKNISAIICIILVILIILIPLGAIVTGVTNQASNYLQEGNLGKLLENLSQNEILKNLNINFESLAERSLSLGVSLLQSALKYIPSISITIFIIILGMFYMLTNWEKLSKEISMYLPFKDKKKVAKEISTVTNNIIYGTILIAMIEFIVAVIGFYISGVEFYLLLSGILFFFAFIPGLGPIVVWLPLTIYYLISGNYFSFIGVLITGLILSNFIDIILRAKIIGNKTKVNSFVMILGILGGIKLFGIFGFIIGPLVLLYTIKIVTEAIEDN